MNEYVAWEMCKEKQAELMREAEEARLAASVAGPDSVVNIVTLVVLAIAAIALWLMF